MCCSKSGTAYVLLEIRHKALLSLRLRRCPPCCPGPPRIFDNIRKKIIIIKIPIVGQALIGIFVGQALV
jgi:hypothetical protein